ncbi:amino acid adenylation domain-containing protein [Streptomyces sp. NBC_00250]|uniref:amino acid adenylation domain-containing protein n=1 Tax=Streptomyces sp. NBC_00250 TaxID=2903641 RepID=UPI002E2C9CEA|nr:amino acid adenylation domain-containing protein [Streptomyces sp. NBC_00250]
MVNDKGQFSLWPADRPFPHGWHSTGFTGTRTECLAEIERIAAAGTGKPASAGGLGTPEPRRPAVGEAALMGSVRDVPDLSITALIRARNLPPEQPAAGHGTVHMTRGELLGTSAGWARVLVAEGCGREVPVAVLLPRGLDALTAILAVLEAGGAYVPLSCDQPLDQLRATLDDCGAALVIATDDLARALGGPDRRTLTVTDLRDAAPGATAVPEPARADDLAYVFYTSGTTGEPKGVEGTHRQLVNYALWCAEAFAHRPGETMFLSASLFFLGSLTTIFTPLLEGWPVTILPDKASTDELSEVCAAVDGGLLKLTPTHIRMLMAREVPEGGLARQLMVGSEPLTFSRELARWMAADPDRVVVNHYGLTETHGCFCHWLSGTEGIGTRVPVGRPVDNAEAYIVGSDGELAGVDEVGELFVGGPSIGRGYRRRPAQTAERWTPHPWGTDGARLLRTGDLARMDAEGVVTVLGRADRQVKIRGHRVEPAAVEEALRMLPDVKEALVLPRETDGQTGLAAYILHEEGAELSAGAVRSALEERFPPQWVPARMAILSEFPVNANGKVDVRALPEPHPVLTLAPHTAGGGGRWTRTDRLVADAFCEVLRIEEIGLEDGFYELGGDSLAAMEVAARVGGTVGRDVPPPTADGATVREYALRIASDTGASGTADADEPTRTSA